MINCPLCGNLVDIKEKIRSYYSSHGNKEYTLHECNICKVQFWFPLEVDLSFYESEFEGSYQGFHYDMPVIGARHKSFFKHYPKEKKSVLLDVGCADCAFLNEAKKCGFNVWGIDGDKLSIAKAKELFNFENIYNMSIDDFLVFAEERKVKFDVVTFFEVLEHLTNPQVFIKRVKNLLNENGMICGTVPTKDRFLVELDRYNNNGDFPPHHFMWFSKEVIMNFLEKEGFVDIKVFPVKYSLFNASQWFVFKLFSKLIASVERIVLVPKKHNSENKIINKKRIFIANVLKFFLRIFENVILFIPSFIVMIFLNRKGYQIYFQATYKKR